MIMNRRTFKIQIGEVEHAIEMLRTEGPKVNFPGPVRVYHTLTGEFNQIIIEYEFPDLATYDAFWQEWSASELAAAFMPGWNAINLPGGSNELFFKEIEL
ncbi:MAG: hypothetical protein R3C14_23040 [Caldilineaceae bacterium]